MILKKARQNTGKIIDRTIMELCRSNSDIKLSDIQNFAGLLEKMGVGFIEVDANMAWKLSKLPSSMLIYRVETKKDAELCRMSGAKQCIVNCDSQVESSLIESLYRYGMSVAVEIHAGCIESLNKVDDIFEKVSLRFVDTVRLTGMEEYEHQSWRERLNRLRREYMIKFDVCPYNVQHCSTSIALEGLMNGIEYATASFGGYGAHKLFAPLEEVMVCMVLHINNEGEFDLTLLPQISREFCNFTGSTIPLNKAIIGQDIFKYESGVHAHGIQKSPMTYEPFPPEMVGQKREMTIGKHSGKNAVQMKLEELGISINVGYLDVLLEAIRRESVKLKRALEDEEIKSMVETGVCR